MIKRIRRSITALVVAACIIVACVPAYSAQYETEGVCGPTLYWKYTVEDKTLTISGEGPMYNYLVKTSKQSVAPWTKISTDITKVVIEEGCTRIGNFAFSYIHGIKDIVFPRKTLVEIGNDAFSHMDSLTNVVLPDCLEQIGTDLFNTCAALTSVDFGDGVAAVSKNACYGDTNLRYVKFGDNCKAVMQNAFYGCKSLVEADVSMLEEISGNAFCECVSLKEAHFGKNIKIVGPYSFSGCSSLESIIFDATPVDISSYFNYGTPSHNSQKDGFYTICGGEVLLAKNPFNLSMTSYEVPDGVKVVGGGAFNRISGLTSVTLPDSVECISSEAFSNTEWLRKIELPSGIKYIGEKAFGLKTSSGNLDYLARLTLYCRGCCAILCDYCTEAGAKLECRHENEKVTRFFGCENVSYVITRCSVCGYESDVEQVPAKGHQFVIEQTQATCTEPFNVKGVCSVCGCEMPIFTGEPSGHVVSEDKLVVKPTCSEYGYVATVCSVCGECLDKVLIEKTGHDMSEEKAVLAEPGCTESGIEGYYCSLCGEYFEKTDIPPLGHSFGEFFEVVSAIVSEGTDAYYVRICGRCGRAESKWISADGSDGDGAASVENGAKYVRRIITGEIPNEGFVIPDYDFDGIVTTADIISIRETLTGEIHIKEGQR